ncbi:hypothetical protein ILUMI_09525 [Ignelater luminosus]|uniref:RNB domain-containing protein n=1 Tax=Ignelater luminosus TaxID=2038154 RepID=A0A8K0D3P6_IGNLU|nr:hypothetical protein ILUMI_09525 [Ignelater luminosus]
MDSTSKLQKQQNGLDSSASQKYSTLQKQGDNGSLLTNEKKKIKRNKAKNTQPPTTITCTETHKQSESQKDSKEKTAKKSELRKFPLYWTKEQAEEGLAKGELFKGSIRIHPRNNRLAYVSNKDPTESDYLIPTAIDRNRALEGDVVVIQIKPMAEWQRNKKTATVVYILEKIHTRIAVGTLHTMKDHQFAKFVPRDYRIPKIRIIVQKDFPWFYVVYMSDYKDRLYKAKITSWNDTDHAVGTVIAELGKVGELSTEIKATIVENDLDTVSFPKESLEGVSITDEAFSSELECREDLRKECIFTIDPLSTHDIDDAMSCKKLDNGNFEVGVHISDVAFYLKEGTTLDQVISKKATSAYLINQVLHMLPKELRSTCSLLPGLDKLTISIFWEMTLTGRIIKQHFARSVINSCCQLAYEHAQRFIENPLYVFQDDSISIFGDFTCKDLSRAINYLHMIATNLRRQRFENGALQMWDTKLDFKLDKETGEPSGFNMYESKEANKLIEEFMILANQTVAQKIIDSFPNYAFLRCHDPADQNTLETACKLLKGSGIKLDVSSSWALQNSIWELKEDPLKMALVNRFVVKAMSRARYVCAQDTKNKQEFFHYALNLPAYTHFTSPIRRYADIVVHRLLEASLGYTGKRFWKTKHLVAVAKQCNKQKWSAKCAEEECNDLYLAHYIENNQPFIADAIVINVTKKFFTILVGATGSIISLYPEKMGENVKYSLWRTKTRKECNLVIPDTNSANGLKMYDMHLCTVLRVKIFRKGKTSKLDATLL